MVEMVIETPRGTRHHIEAEITNRGNGNVYLEADDGRGFKLYDDGRIMGIAKCGLKGRVVAGVGA